jgi:hypothetical protein
LIAVKIPVWQEALKGRRMAAAPAAPLHFAAGFGSERLI